MGVACKPGLSNTVVHSRSQLSAKQCLLRRYLFGESSLWISQLIVLECCSSMLLQSEYENCISYFHEQLENFKTCKNWALYSIELSLVLACSQNQLKCCLLSMPTSLPYKWTLTERKSVWAFVKLCTVCYFWWWKCYHIENHCSY